MSFWLEQRIFRVEQFVVVQFDYFSVFLQLLQVYHLGVTHDGDCIGFAFDVRFVELHDVVEGQCIDLRQLFFGRVFGIALVTEVHQIHRLAAEVRMVGQGRLAQITLDVVDAVGILRML